MLMASQTSPMAKTTTTPTLAVHTSDAGLRWFAFRRIIVRTTGGAANYDERVSSANVAGRWKWNEHTAPPTASAIASTEADLGSNSQEFWFYMKRNDPPDLFYCAYNDLPTAQIKLPLQPDWIAEALCVQEMNPAEYEMRDVKSGIELIKRIQHQGEQLY